MIKTAAIPSRKLIAIFFVSIFTLIVFAFLIDPSYTPRFIAELRSHSSTPLTCLASIQQQRSILLGTYTESLVGVTHVALVDYPDHPNKGDSAIWVGEIALLDALGIKIAYICTWATDEYQKQDLIDSLAGVPKVNTAILMHGGGNLGDLWWLNTALKIKVVDDFPDRKIRFFPQTVRFSKADKTALTQASFGSHTDLEFVGRDSVSYATLKELFPNNSVKLTPDMAFMIGYDATNPHTPWQLRSDQPASLSSSHWPHINLTGPVRDVTVMSRTDGEGGQKHFLFDWAESLAPLNGVSMDWLKEDPWLGGLPSRQYLSADGTEDWLRYWNDRAVRRVEWAFDFLSSGRVLVADRLHAHILSTLIGVGHVILEEGSYAKIRKYQNTWLEGCLAPSPLAQDGLSKRGLQGRETDGLVVFVESESEAVRVVKSWLLETAGRDISRVV